MVFYARSIPFSALLWCSNIQRMLLFRSLYQPMDACCLKRLLAGFTEITFPPAKRGTRYQISKLTEVQI